MLLASIPSPPFGEIHLGPLPIRAYALCIVAGVFVAVWLGERRWVARGGRPGAVGDVAVWAVPFGLVGGRLYHVVTTYEPYFGPGGNPWNAFAIWHGGLGIWGAITLGGVGAWIGARRQGIPLPALADALAPGIVLAQAIGRWGNYFNQELFGRPTTLPWGLRIDAANRPIGYEQFATFHPTFLYESLWDVGVAVLVVWADRRFRMGHGRAFALYVAAYTVGRAWVEWLRIDDAHHILGLRLNDWTSIVVFTGAVLYIVISARLRPGREVLVDGALVSAEVEGDDERAGAEPGGEVEDGEAARGAATDSASRDTADRDSADRDSADRDSADRDSADRDSADRDREALP